MTMLRMMRCPSCQTSYAIGNDETNVDNLTCNRIETTRDGQFIRVCGYFLYRAYDINWGTAVAT